ncbi:hypothetical protein KY360_01965 [Candidatus Woesearchaeota archaeon]|nr:hypothetical protein [Candidatus Woesearchaeota archaeon]
MKENAMCYFCNKGILDKNNYIIFTLPRLKYKYRASHKDCYDRYLATHPQLTGGTAYGSTFAFIRILNSWTAWGILLIFMLMESFLILRVRSRIGEPVAGIYNLIEIPIILILAFVILYHLGYRIYFYFKCE